LLKLAVVGSGNLLVDVVWFHIGCFNVTVFLVTLQHMSCSHCRVWLNAMTETCCRKVNKRMLCFCGLKWLLMN